MKEIITMALLLGAAGWFLSSQDKARQKERAIMEEANKRAIDTARKDAKYSTKSKDILGAISNFAKIPGEVLGSVTGLLGGLFGTGSEDKKEEKKEDNSYLPL